MVKVKDENHLKQLLEDTGLNARKYVKTPFGMNRFMFIMSLANDNVLRFQLGDADVTVHTNKRFRQAVVIAKEEKRVTEVRYLIPNYNYYSNIEDWKDTLTSRAKTRRPLYGRGVSSPFDIRILTPDEDIVDSTNDNVKVQAKVRLPAATNIFLVGYDENSQFISVLPEEPTSVTHAHEILKPEGLAKGYLRHGEYFLSPVTPDQQEVIDKVVQSRPESIRTRPLDHSRGKNIAYDHNGEIDDWRSYRNPSSHRATQTLHLEKEGSPTGKRVLAASGIVYDKRQNRHKSIVLNGWYNVLRNREIEPPEGSQYWD